MRTAAEESSPQDCKFSSTRIILHIVKWRRNSRVSSWNVSRSMMSVLQTPFPKGGRPNRAKTIKLDIFWKQNETQLQKWSIVVEHRRLHCSSHRLGKKERGGKRLLRSKFNRSLACIDSCSTVREKRAVSTQKQQFFLDRMEDKGRKRRRKYRARRIIQSVHKRKIRTRSVFSLYCEHEKGNNVRRKTVERGAGNVF